MTTDEAELRKMALDLDGTRRGAGCGDPHRRMARQLPSVDTPEGCVHVPLRGRRVATGSDRQCDRLRSAEACELWLPDRSKQ